MEIGLGIAVGAGMILVLTDNGPEKYGARIRLLGDLCVRCLRDSLGLILPGKQALRVLLAGIVAAGVCLVLALLLKQLPWLNETTSGPDPREDAVNGATMLVRSLFAAIYAPAGEELAFRGLLMTVATLVTWMTVNRRVRGSMIVASLIISSVIFGALHTQSLLNAVSATVNGFIFGAAALTTRSLWVAIVAHTVYNAVAVLVP